MRNTPGSPAGVCGGARWTPDATPSSIFDMLDWLDKRYGDRPEREQNNSLPTPRFRRPAKP
jgi:hypothetical protein